MEFNALNRQKSIYLDGFAGVMPKIPTDFVELEAKAKMMMSKEATAYIAGGAGNGETMRNNRTGFERIRIRPRMLHDVSQRDISVELFGQRFPAPVLLAPVGVLTLAHKQGSIAVAQAASSLGVPMIFSNQASYPMESCAAEMGNSPKWFQLYWSKSDELVASFLQRAERCGCSALVVTLDTTMLGWRPQDLDMANLPFLFAKGIGQYTSDPVFMKLIQQMKENPIDDGGGLSIGKLLSFFSMVARYPGKGFFSKLRSGIPLKAIRTFIGTYSRPSIQWNELSFLRKHTTLPIILKGILRADDAKRAIDAGVDGIIVSNHGGRQVNGSIGAIEALPEVVQAVNDRIPVLMDSGIRRGSDIFKALAVGAKAVCVGRPYVYGLALGGAQGVREVLLNLLADFELTMGLTGCSSLAEITSDMIRTP